MRLADDEELVLDLRASAGTLLRPVLVLLVVLAGAGFLAARTEGAGRLAVLAAAAVLLVPFVLVPFLRWRAERCVVTDQRLLLRSGVLARSGRDVPLTRVDEVTFRQTLWQRLLRRGTLVVAAGDAEPVVVPDLPDVEAVQRELYALVDQALDAQR